MSDDKNKFFKYLEKDIFINNKIQNKEKDLFKVIIKNDISNLYKDKLNTKSFNTILQKNSLVSQILNAGPRSVKSIEQLLRDIAAKTGNTAILEMIPLVKGIFANPEIPFVAKQIKLFHIMFDIFRDGLTMTKSVVLKIAGNNSELLNFLINQDLLKVSILNNEDSLRNLLKKVLKFSPLFEKKEKGETLTDEEEGNMANICELLFLTVFDPLNPVKKIESYKDLKNFFGCKKGENLLTGFHKTFFAGLGFENIESVVSFMESRMTERERENVEFSRRFVLQKGDLVKGFDVNFADKNFSQGFFSPEFIGIERQESDRTPFDVDFVELEKGTLEEMHSTRANDYGNVFLVLKKDNRWTDGRMEKGMQYEGIRPGVVTGNHFALRTGFAATDINALIFKSKYEGSAKSKMHLDKLKFSVLNKGFYIPIFDSKGILLFSYEEYKYLLSTRKILEQAVLKKDLNTLVAYLDDENLNMQVLIEVIRVLSGNDYSKSVGVSEGYYFGEHMLYVFRQFEVYGKKMFEDLKTGLPLWFMRLIIVLHDIGKPSAIEATNDTKRQHEFTLDKVRQICVLFNVQSEITNILLSLFKKDYLGDLLKSNQSVLEVSENVKKAAKEAGLDVKTFYSLLKVSYFQDAII